MASPLMFEEIKQTLDDFRVALRRLVPRERPARDGASSTPSTGCASWAHIYENDGALWLRTTDIRRRQGPGASSGPTASRTYFAGDPAYYLNKRDRGFDRCIYPARRRPPRLRRPADGDGGRVRRRPGSNIEILIGQMVNLLRDGSRVG